MCGRYYIDDATAREIEKIIKQVSDKIYQEKSGRDIYPSAKAPVIIKQESSLFAEEYTWGFPNFGKSGVIFNARSETVLEKRTFKDSILSRRCIIPASGFYEWTSGKEKYFFKPVQNRVLFFAGFYKRFQEENRFVILTTDANASVKKVHSRMPLILEPDELENWMYDEKSLEFLLHKTPEPLSGQAQGQLSLFDM